MLDLAGVSVELGERGSVELSVQVVIYLQYRGTVFCGFPCLFGCLLGIVGSMTCTHAL